jgi:hypothetical protein
MLRQFSLHPSHALSRSAKGLTQSFLFPGNPKDFAVALGKMQKMADEGDSDAQYALGLAYLNGEMGLTSDIETAKKWLIRYRTVLPSFRLCDVRLLRTRSVSAL